MIATSNTQIGDVMSTHFDITDEYVTSCARMAWANSKSVELANRANRLAAQGKTNHFTLKLRSFIISSSLNDKEMLSKLILAWGKTGPFYDAKVKSEITKLMEQK